MIRINPELHNCVVAVFGMQASNCFALKLYSFLVSGHSVLSSGTGHPGCGICRQHHSFAFMMKLSATCEVMSDILLPVVAGFRMVSPFDSVLFVVIAVSVPTISEEVWFGPAMRWYKQTRPASSVISRSSEYHTRRPLPNNRQPYQSSHHHHNHRNRRRPVHPD